MARLRSLLPYFHLMALAPLDVWARLLREPPATIPIRYWPRLAVALLCSSAATLLTLPERLLYALWTRLSPADPRRLPAPLFVLGYYRSGTTHLQSMLSCDPAFCSPRWFQALAPQGFALSWGVLRFFLVPFLPSRRFQDAMRFGANAPAEDDFALNNWGLVSTLPGRAVLPRSRAFYDRFHDLERLTDEERERWRSTLVSFVHKLCLLGGKRRPLLKSPSHTARVATLLRLFPRAQFVHVSRRPDSVLGSNLALLRTAQERYSLQGCLFSRQQVIEEYAATEERYLRDRALIPPGQLAEVRLEDLLADPIGETRRLYAELGLDLGEAFEQRLNRYLVSTQGYTPNVHEASPAEPRLAELARQLGHDGEPIARGSAATTSSAAAKPHSRGAVRGGIWLHAALVALRSRCRTSPRLADLADGHRARPYDPSRRRRRGRAARALEPGVGRARPHRSGGPQHAHPPLWARLRSRRCSPRRSTPSASRRASSGRSWV